MRTVQSWMPAALSLALGACANVETAPESLELGEQAAALSNEQSDSQITYLVKRDYKRCAAPRCGGFYLTRPNFEKLTCADGKRARECYVAQIEFENGQVAEDGELVRGSLENRWFEGVNETFGVLHGSAAFTPVIAEPRGTTAQGYYYAPYSTGMMCARTPCASMGVVAVNTDQSGSLLSVAFNRKDEGEKAAIEQAFFENLGENLEAAHAASSAVVVGKFKKHKDLLSGTWVQQLQVSNVYTPKDVPHRQCLVREENDTITAWNTTSEAQLEALADGMTGEVTIMEGSCADQAIMCTMIYAPVHGSIDALGEECITKSSACGFRGAVIAAAGVDGKASGRYEAGPCAGNVACASDADCTDGFCGWTADDSRVCRPWAVEGEHCEGFVVPEARRFCRPDLTCEFVEPTGDAGGICR